MSTDTALADRRPGAAARGHFVESVLETRHYTDKLFSFRTTRDPAFRFESGQFVMIGLEVDGRPLMRAYSMASSKYEDTLEFFSIKVPSGPLTSRLQHIRHGDAVLIGKKPTGTLVLANLKPGRRLFMLSTGTGLAPFSSLIKDLDLYDAYEQIILVHGCREVAELAYGTETVNALREDPYLGEQAQAQLLYYTTVTREPYYHQGRITDLIDNGRLFSDLGIDGLDPAADRVMLCGNPEMLKDMRAKLEGMSFKEGSSGEPGDYVIEKAFVER
jgi:ferredoxin--NADP+ reductase